MEINRGIKFLRLTFKFPDRGVTLFLRETLTVDCAEAGGSERLLDRGYDLKSRISYEPVKSEVKTRLTLERVKMC